MPRFIVAESRAELIAHYALDAFEETEEQTIKGWDTLNDDQRHIVYLAVHFGACGLYDVGRNRYV
jgi:hypothetical protein